MKKQLHIISEYFPYGNGEQFFENEVSELSDKFDIITVYPLGKVSDNKRELPKNVNVSLVLANRELQLTNRLVLKHLTTILAVFLTELIQSKRRKYIISHFKMLLGTIVLAGELGHIFKEQINSNYTHYFHSFWMNKGALMLAILKKKRIISAFHFRVNGYEIFDERRDGNYMPYRFFNYKMVNKIHVPSKEALKYLEAINYYPEKLTLSYHGVYDNGINPMPDNKPYLIVSCASLIRLKRVDKIIDALKNVEFEVEWIHYGGGPLMDTLAKEASKLPHHIKFKLMGNRANHEILDLYKSKPVSLFIHTSETEGLGMAIVEAQSFGIPAVVIGVGGVVDIVDNRTGIVLNEDCSIEDISLAIKDAIEKLSVDLVKRQKIKEITMSKFSADNNYQELFNKIISGN